MAANGILEFQGTERAIFRGSNSNIVIDTANSSFGVGVDTPTSNLHIVGKTSLQGDLNLVQVSNVANVTVNSNVVAEYTGPHDRPLRKYPEVALTSASQGGYVVTASSDQSQYNLNAWRIFDGVKSAGTGWASQDGTYYDGTSPANSYTGTAHQLGTGTAYGEWLKLELPKKIKVSKFILYADPGVPYGTNEAPKSYKIYGSVTGSSWTELKDVSNETPSTNGNSHIITDTTAYRYVGIVVTQVNTDQDNIRIGELEFYGHEEGSASLDTTLKTVYNVPATTGTQLEVYYDAKDLTTMPSTVTDLSGGDQNGVVTSVTLDSTNGIESFNFDGTLNNAITTTLPSTFVDNQVHSVAFWFYYTSTKAVIYPFHIGTNGNNDSIGMWIGDGTESTGSYLNYFFYGNDCTITSHNPLVVGTWNHVALVHNGTDSERRLYINNTHVEFDVISNNGPLSLPASSTLYIGRSSYYSAGDATIKIANFRLYSKALNADQVKELYDYQKDYFFGSKSQVTLYKGHLGVGVTEPSGQLELAGDERLQEYPPGPLTDYETHIPGHGVFCAYAGDASAYSGSPHFFHAWKAFDDTSGIYHGGNRYTGTDRAYVGSIQLHGQSINGDYIVLEMPYQIKVQSVTLGDQGSRMVKDFTIVGSNDGVTWTTIRSVTDAVFSSTQQNFSLNATEYFSKLAIIVTKLQNDSYWNHRHIRYFGTPGPTTLDKGSLSLTRSLDVPRISRYDVDTETPRPEKLVVDFDTTVNSTPTDISGKGNHGTFNGGASYSETNKAFDFPNDVNTASQNVKINTVSPVRVNTDIDISFSVWVKVDTASTTGWRAIWEMGSRGSYKHFSLYIPGSTAAANRGPNQFAFETWSQGFYPTGDTVEANRWYHVVCTYNKDTRTKKLYVDGVYKNGGTITTGAYSSGIANPPLRIGTNLSDGEGWAGHVSNFKVYKDAILEASEVRKLYKLGRTGRSMVISDTAVGIGKVPEAQLDVRGVARLERLLINGTLGHVLLEEAEIYYDPSRAECQDRTEFMNNTVRDIKGNYHGTKTGISEYNQFWAQDADNSGIATNNNVDLRRDWTAMVWMKPGAADNLGIWRILGHGTTSSNQGLHFQGADGSRLRAGMYSNDIDVGTATGMSRRREWNCMTFAYYHNNGVAGGCDKMIYQNERLVGHQQAGIGDGTYFSGDVGGSAYQNGHQPYSASPNILRFGAGFSSGNGGKQYQHIGPCIFIPRFLSSQEVRSLYRFFAMRFTRVGAND